MQNDKIVSIIIPTYNVEKYVHRAIESSLNQTHPSVEVIIIDDGSTDNTWKIVNKYCKENDNIKFFRQENRGVSFARNKGLEIASGNYILFLDSDDWLELNAVSTLIELSELYPDSFICVDRFFAYYDERNNIYRQRQNMNLMSEYVEGIDALKCFADHRFNLQSSCYKIFKMQVIKDNNFRFDTKLYHGEDGFFVFEYLNKVKKIYYSNDALWNILERPGSATKSTFDRKMLTAITAVNQMINYPNLSSEIRIELHEYLVERTLMVKNMFVHSKINDEESLTIINFNLKQNKNVYLMSNVSIKRKIYFLLMLYLPLPILKKIF